MAFDKSSAEPTVDGARSTDAPRIFFLWGAGSSSVAVPGPGQRVTIGRTSQCDVSVEHASVSRSHAIIHGGDTLSIEDLGSSNGTFKNDQRLAPNRAVPFGPGDAVRVGTVSIVVHGAAPRSSPRSAPALPEDPNGPVVVDDAMRELHRLARTVAKSPIAVILRGETGVGKEVLAETIHRASARASRPLVKLNCAALSEQLLEAELFGYEKGAFTGAAAAKPGLLEAADGGTVFLDEVGEMAPSTQAKLLRAVASGEVLRLGSLKPRTVDVRFVSATHRDLEAMVRTGAFREDLYFRLDGISLVIPPLRERRGEILVLARRFVAAASARARVPEATISPEASEALLRHAWPGNIRELKNVVERALVLSEGATIRPEHVVVRAASPSATQPAVAAAPASDEPMALPEELARVEVERITAALRQTGGNQTAAAKLLGISRRTLVYRLSALKIDRRGGG